MSVKAEKKDKYLSLKVEGEGYTPEICTSLKEQVTASLEKGDLNYIIQLNPKVEPNPEIYSCLDYLMNIILKEEGSLVVTGCATPAMQTAIENRGIMVTRKFDEAVDYVFMEDMERQMNEGGSEENFEEEDDL